MYNNHHKDYQRIVKLKYSTDFFIHTFCRIVQQLHLIHGSTTISPTQSCALSDGVSNFFACPHLLSAPVSYVVSSFVNSSTFASESGGGTQKQPQTQQQTHPQTQPQITQEELKTATPPQSMKTPSMLVSMATTRVAKVETATGKDGNSVTQIGMQLKYPTIRSAITIQSVLKSIKKYTSKSDLHLLWINFHILFGYI